ncbi:hypothetical protein DFH09DRAFT_1284373 [Mycena vulgaris]|nr:hypothetical protein DFH09DRAFT_1284373 [Mycena vulgaris]
MSPSSFPCKRGHKPPRLSLMDTTSHKTDHPAARGPRFKMSSRCSSRRASAKTGRKSSTPQAPPQSLTRLKNIKSPCPFKAATSSFAPSSRELQAPCAPDQDRAPTIYARSPSLKCIIKTSPPSCVKKQLNDKRQALAEPDRARLCSLPWDRDAKGVIYADCRLCKAMQSGSLAVQARNYNSKDTRDENNKGDMELDEPGGAKQEGQGAVTARSVVEDASGSLDGAFGVFGALDGRKESAGMSGFWEDEWVGEEKDGAKNRKYVGLRRKEPVKDPGDQSLDFFEKEKRPDTEVLYCRMTWPWKKMTRSMVEAVAMEGRGKDTMEKGKRYRYIAHQRAPPYPPAPHGPDPTSQSDRLLFTGIEARAAAAAARPRLAPPASSKRQAAPTTPSVGARVSGLRLVFPTAQTAGPRAAPPPSSSVDRSRPTRISAPSARQSAPGRCSTSTGTPVEPVQGGGRPHCVRPTRRQRKEEGGKRRDVTAAASLAPPRATSLQPTLPSAGCSSARAPAPAFDAPRRSRAVPELTRCIASHLANKPLSHRPPPPPMRLPRPRQGPRLMGGGGRVEASEFPDLYVEKEKVSLMRQRQRSKESRARKRRRAPCGSGRWDRCAAKRRPRGWRVERSRPMAAGEAFPAAPTPPSLRPRTALPLSRPLVRARTSAASRTRSHSRSSPEGAVTCAASAEAQRAERRRARRPASLSCARDAKACPCVPACESAPRCDGRRAAMSVAVKGDVDGGDATARERAIVCLSFQHYPLHPRAPYMEAEATSSSARHRCWTMKRAMTWRARVRSRSGTARLGVLGVGVTEMGGLAKKVRNSENACDMSRETRGKGAWTTEHISSCANEHRGRRGTSTGWRYNRSHRPAREEGEGKELDRHPQNVRGIMNESDCLNGNRDRVRAGRKAGKGNVKVVESPEGQN